MTPYQKLLKKQSPFAGVRGSVLSSAFLVPISIAELWNYLVPSYTSQNYGPMIARVEWNREYPRAIGSLSERRTASRWSNYVDAVEVVRSSKKLRSKGEASIRFGFEKPGHGYSKERGDFCLIAGVVKNKQLTVYYRSLEMIGGFAYDLTLLNQLEYELGCEWREITIVTCKAFVFALKGNSNEKLFPKLQRIFQ